MKQFYKNLLVEEKTIEKREHELSRALNDFIKYYGANYDSSEFKILKDSSKIISAIYHEILHKGVKKYIHKRTSRYKMASLTELCVVRAQPFRSDDLIAQRKLNAQFAFYLSIGIIESITPSQFDQNFAIKSIGEFFDEIKEKHIEWLSIKPIEMMCVISNEHSLALMHQFYSHRWSSMQGQ